MMLVFTRLTTFDPIVGHLSVADERSTVSLYTGSRECGWWEKVWAEYRWLYGCMFMSQ